MNEIGTFEIAQNVFNKENGLFSNGSLREMVNLWLSNEERIMKICGHISDWNVSNVTDMSSLFTFTSFIEDISRWNTSNVTSMSRMFACNLKFNQNVSTWNINKVIDMSGMFDNASSFDYDLSAWKLNKNTNVNHMFDNTNISLKMLPKFIEDEY